MRKLLVTKNTPPIRVEIRQGDEYGVLLVKPRLSLVDLRTIQAGAVGVGLSPEGAVEFSTSGIGSMIAACETAVVDWEGPLFEGVKYTPLVWRDLSAEYAWVVEQAFTKINEMNAPPTTPPKSQPAGSDSEDAPA